MEYKDYYKILGVARDAGQDDIKRAYRKLARKYHPDVSKETDAEARFKEINEANEVLKDPTKRAEYDALGTGWHAGDEFRPPPGAGTHRREHEFSPEEAAHFSDFFSSIFGGGGGMGGFGGARGARDDFRRRGTDQTARIRISLEDAYHGASRQLRLDVPEFDKNGQVQTRSRTLNVRIPAGITEGQQIRLAGQGSPGLGGEPGDLFLEVEFEPHPVYRCEGRDIDVRLPISPWEAALGATVPVPTLGGTVSLKIPAGSQSNQRLRLKGRGLPGGGSSKTAGDAFVQLEIVNPPTLDDAARTAYEELSKRFGAFNPRAKLGV
jgi:curved DNA-binding protein